MSNLNPNTKCRRHTQDPLPVESILPHRSGTANVSRPRRSTIEHWNPLVELEDLGVKGVDTSPRQLTWMDHLDITPTLWCSGPLATRGLFETEDNNTKLEPTLSGLTRITHLKFSERGWISTVHAGTVPMHVTPSP